MFQHVNYSKEFYKDGKFVGSLILEKPDRNIMGYSGRRIENISEPFEVKKTSKKITLKAGLYKTELIQICGKLIGTQKEKFEILKNSKLLLK